MSVKCPNCGSTNLWEHQLRHLWYRVRKWDYENQFSTEWDGSSETGDTEDVKPLFWCKDCDSDFNEPIFEEE